MSKPYTHVQLMRELRDYDGNLITGSSLVVESPVYIPANANDAPQEELFDWVLQEFPGWIPMAYVRMERTNGNK